MNREDVINSDEYKVSKAALEWYSNNQDADALDGFEVGYAEAKKQLIEKACGWLADRVAHDSIDYPMATKHLVNDFKKYMEE